MDASTCGRRPRQQQREQSDWKVMGTLEKWTAKPVLKRQEVHRVDSRVGWSRVEGRGSRVAGRGWAGLFDLGAGS